MPAAATLSFSLAASHPLSGSVPLGYTVLAAYDPLALTGAETYTIDTAAIPAAGCKGMIVTLDQLDGAGVPATAAVTVRWTSHSASKSEEVSPGGLIIIASPAPVFGVTMLALTSTANALVRVVLLG